MIHHKHQKNKEGLSLVIALLVATVALAIGLSLLDVTLRQFILSSVARDSEISFHAAYAGIECARFQDVRNNAYAVPHSGVSVGCMGTTDTSSAADSGDEQLFEYQWGNDSVACTQVSMYKFDATSAAQTIPGALIGGDTPIDNRLCNVGFVCTVAQARGYNVACSDVGAARTVEREVVIIY